MKNLFTEETTLKIKEIDGKAVISVDGVPSPLAAGALEEAAYVLRDTAVGIVMAADIDGRAFTSEDIPAYKGSHER